MEQSPTIILPDHAILVFCDRVSQNMGLVQALEQVSLSQKTVEHSPQEKVFEFFVAI